ncbi:hypothetical protein Q9966_012148 [Columba livia]|nr:hypothetical protein Q9966_012148 [Columba livia]
MTLSYVANPRAGRSNAGNQPLLLMDTCNVNARCDPNINQELLYLHLLPLLVVNLVVLLTPLLLRRLHIVVATLSDKVTWARFIVAPGAPTSLLGRDLLQEFGTQLTYGKGKAKLIFIGSVFTLDHTPKKEVAIPWELRNVPLDFGISHSLGQHTLQSTWVTPLIQEHLQDNHKGPQEGSGWPRSTNTEAAAEAECPAPAPQGPTAVDTALWDTAQRIVSEAMRRAVAEIMAAGQEPEEQQDLAQRMDLQDENSKEGCQGGDTIHSIWINPSVQEHLQDAPAGPQEGSGLPSCTDTEAAAEAERPAPAQHSPTEDSVDLADIVQYIISEAVCRAEAEIQGPGQQPVEQQDLAQCMDVPVAAPAPAGLEAIEAHLAGEDEGQASTAPLVPVAKDEEENTVSPMSAEHGRETSADIACPVHGPAPQRRPSQFRRALQALHRAFRCSCTAGQQEE